MNGNALTPQVIDSEHAADYVSSQVIEYQDFPYWVALFIEQGIDLILRGSWIFAGALCRRKVMIEAQYSFDGR